MMALIFAIVMGINKLPKCMQIPDMQVKNISKKPFVILDFVGCSCIREYGHIGRTWQYQMFPK